MLPFNFVIVCGFFEWKWICGDFVIYLYMHCRWRFSYQEGKNEIWGRNEISVIDLTPPHLCVWSNPGLGFPMSYVVVLQWVKVWFGFMVLNATFNNISVVSWQSVLLVEETGVSRENHSGIRWEVVVRFVDISGIVDHQCFKHFLIT